jgi:hypothetical protein
LPFEFYNQLTRRQQRDYRKSDEIESLPLPQEVRLNVWDRVDALEEALGTGNLKRLQAATAEFSLAVTQAFGVGSVRVQVKSRRPMDRAGAEYYGLTTWEEGKQPLIELWMRTRAQRRVVAFKTYMRTLIHELLHHLDYSYLGLGETFHTEGFFKRESSLFRQLVTERPPRMAVCENMGEPGSTRHMQQSAEKKREDAPPPCTQKTEPNAEPKPPKSSGRRCRRKKNEQLMLPFK